MFKIVSHSLFYFSNVQVFYDLRIKRFWSKRPYSVFDGAGMFPFEDTCFSLPIQTALHVSLAKNLLLNIKFDNVFLNECSFQKFIFPVIMIKKTTYFSVYDCAVEMKNIFSLFFFGLPNGSILSAFVFHLIIFYNL